jgi:hypothetical protein
MTRDEIVAMVPVNPYYVVLIYCDKQGEHQLVTTGIRADELALRLYAMADKVVAERIPLKGTHH